MKKLLIATAVVVLAAFAAPAFAATNPFMDVPASHWAYDAVAQLASRGVVSGYPDGTYKGSQPISRYEMASIIARSLAYVDNDKASKQDVEMLKRLIVEFSDELTALGVTVDALDGRVGQLESDLGGWKLSGEFEFNAKFGDDNSFYGSSGKNDFDVDKYRIFLDKRINETTTFRARLGRGGAGARTSSDPAGPVLWEQYYITTKLAYDVTFEAGRFLTNWEDDLRLVADDDAFVGDIHRQGLRFSKDWGIANLKLLIARDGDNVGAGATGPFEEAFLVAALADFQFNEKFQAGILAYYWFADNDYAVGSTFANIDSVLDLGVYAKFKFHPSVEFKALYYHQAQDNLSAGVEDTASAWKAILAIEQELLKFTSLQLEYAQIDNNFLLSNEPYSNFGNSLLFDVPGTPRAAGTTKVYGAKAAQKWGETKWDSWLRYYHADFDTTGVDDANNYGLGIGYQLNPAVHFELGYDYIDFGNDDDDRLIRFQTLVSF